MGAAGGYGLFLMAKGLRRGHSVSAVVVAVCSR